MRLLAVIFVSVVLAACSTEVANVPAVTSEPTATTSVRTAAPTAAPTAVSATASPGPTTAPAASPPAISAFIEPDAGMTPIYDFISGARHSLDMTMYELVDPTAESLLAADAGRGVDVRVVLDQARERSSNTAAYVYLEAHGVHVEWAPTYFEATHEKAVVDDSGYPGGRLLVMTLNLTSRYYADTRDMAVVDSDPSDVAAAEEAFAADFAGREDEVVSSGDDLVWSPGAAARLTAIIGEARSSILVENEEMSDPTVVAALAAAAQRRVTVDVVMTADSEWDSEFRQLQAAGVSIRVEPDDASHIYIHAKCIVVDDREAFVGSQNFTAASLDQNRELGVITSIPSVVGPVASAVRSDFGSSPAFSG